MKLFAVVAILAILIAVQPCEGEASQSRMRELDNYDLRIQVIHDLLAVECPELNYYLKSRPKRLIEKPQHETILNADKTVYTRLYLQLVACRKAKTVSVKSTTLKPVTPKKTTIKITTTKPKTTTTRRPKTTTTDPKQPKECLGAETFDEPWRMEHNGGDIRGNGSYAYKGYSCDLHADTQWFRFRGAAGNQILNTCPKFKSCGSMFPLWTDEPMPTTVGDIVTIKMYAVSGTNCRKGVMKLNVMKCSEGNGPDFIYKTANPSTKQRYNCADAFCGMY